MQHSQQTSKRGQRWWTGWSIFRKPRTLSPAEEALLDFPLEPDQPLILTVRDENLRTMPPSVHRPNCLCASVELQSCPVPTPIVKTVRGVTTVELCVIQEKIALLHLQLARTYWGKFKIGATLPFEMFNGSPQQHALLNRHIVDYYRSRQRAQETTRYNVPNSQRYLLQNLGMELPQPDAPETPHALHKNIEEFQLRRLGRLYLQDHNFGIISVKDSKLALLPPSGGVQNPVYEAADITRYPGTAIRHAHLRDFPVYLMHDISSVVTPHELVEKLVLENPEAHLIVTGMNPVEVLDGNASFEPASHSIEYDMGNFNFIFTGSESESYFTPSSVTKTWLRTSSVCASNGKVYHVTLIDYKLGHCAWHIYCGQGEDQHTRTFPTGSYVRLPAAVSGTWSDEYLPSALLTGVLAFVDRTPDLSTRNMAAKVSQLSTGLNPRTTARDRWIATRIASELAPHKTFWWYLTKGFWNLAYVLSFQWQMLSPIPDLYTYIDERKRNRTIHPTPGGGWSPRSKPLPYRRSIPNCPSMLQRVSAFTASAFVYLIPKLVIGEVAANVIVRVDYFGWLRWLYVSLDISVLRLLLTSSIVVVTAILPGSVIKVFSRLSGHFWRQLWLPSWFWWLFEAFVTEATGGPGYRLLQTLPGRGWAYQSYLWGVALCAIFPGWHLGFLIPWTFFHCTGLVWVLPVWLTVILLENTIQLWRPAPIPSHWPVCHWSISWWFRCRWNGYPESRQFRSAFKNTLCIGVWRLWIATKVSYNFFLWTFSYTPNAGSCNRVGTLPALPAKPPATIRRLNVDIPMPTVVVLPHRIPGGNVGVALAVEPLGLNFTDWRDQVLAAYNAQPNAYPQLTPGFHCFWDTLSRFGGTPHMWYSWFMSYTRRIANPNDPLVGPVELADIQDFAVASRFGLNIGGLVSEVVHPQGADRPTLNLTLKRSVINGQLHIEWADPTVNTEPVAQLSRILATLLAAYPAWDVAMRNAFNAAPVDFLAKPTPLLRAFAGDHQLPESMVDIADAIVASRTALPVLPAPNNEGFGFDFNRAFAAPWPPLFTFDQPIHRTPIAAHSPVTNWQRFTSLARGVGGRLRLPAHFPHPLANPHMKIGAGRQQHMDNVRRNNSRPDVPLWVTLRNELAVTLDKYKRLILPDVPLEREEIAYTADIMRASRLMADLKAHPSVLETRGNPLVLQSLDSVLDAYRAEGKTVRVKVHCLLGIWGSGKTTETIAYLHTLTAEQRSQVRIVSHTESLRAQARIKVDFPELRGFNFPTIASVLTEPSTGPIIFDDAGKFWGGTLDLVLLTNPLVDFVIVNGDPGQTATKFPTPGTQSEYDLSPVHCVARQTTKYATRTHRGFRLLADTMGVHTTNREQGHITHTVAGKPGLPVCTASPRYVQVLASYGRKAYTYSTIQGEDFKEDVEIDMTGLEGAILDSAAYTAITRSSTGVYLHMEAANPASIIKKPPTGSELINALVYAMRSSNGPSLSQPDWLVKAAFYHHLHNCMPLLPWFASIGASVPASEFQLIADPSETTFVSDSTPLEPSVIQNEPPSAAPFDTYVPEVHFHAKENRELPTRHGATDQFKETAFVNPHVHKRSDTATYFESVKKRLTPATYEDNLKRMQSCPRTDLCDEYDRLVPRPPLWSPEKHQHYVDLAIEEYCSKRMAHTVRSKIAAHDPDRTGSDIVISLKNQVIKKAEKKDKVLAIPGQLIHEYDIHQTISDAAYALFIENEVLDSFPDQFIFFRRMSPSQFKSAYKKRWRVGNGASSSDVTRWDVGCDAGVLNYVVHVFHRSEMPSDFIEGYIQRRLSSRSQHGTMATMQNSGDRFTWVINCVIRAPVTSLTCSMVEEDTAVINGDDGGVDRECDIVPIPDSPWEFKNVNGKEVEFSGFMLGGPEPYYSSEGLHYRTMILISRDPSAQDKWINYLDLLSNAPPDDPLSLDVARSAHQHMKPHLFSQYLPPAYRPHFPTCVF